MKTTFPRTYLSAALICAGNKDARKYLNGVFVEVGTGETRLVGTNGKVMSALQVKQPGDEPFQIIIPRGIIEVALKLSDSLVSLECKNGDWVLQGVPFTPFNEPFPDYRRKVPVILSKETVQFDPENFAKFAKIGKALGLRSFPIFRHSSQLALVHFYKVEYFIGVIMAFNFFTELTPDLGFPVWGCEPLLTNDCDLV